MGPNGEALVRSGVSRDRRLLGVCAVDCALVILVLAYGLTEHAIDPVARPWYTLRTALPFLVGWFVVAPLVGAYRLATIRGILATVVVVPTAWIGASFLGGAIRATELVPGTAPPIFVLVVIAGGIAVLLPWRLGFGWLLWRRFEST